ncbi:MAG: NADH-quinone oxidoreductase subunit C, partial [Anaerolineales bacterium]
MSEQVQTTETKLEQRFPSIVTLDDREGYEGYIVKTDHLVEFATALRDEMGYDFLSSVTGVDYLPEGKMEVVYHVYRSTGGSELVYKVQVPRDKSVVPSLVPVYPGAEFQE